MERRVPVLSIFAFLVSACFISDAFAEVGFQIDYFHSESFTQLNFWLGERLNQSGHVNKLENRIEQVELPSAFSPGVIKNYFDLQNHEPVNDFLGESKTQAIPRPKPPLKLFNHC